MSHPSITLIPASSLRSFVAFVFHRGSCLTCTMHICHFQSFCFEQCYLSSSNACTHWIYNSNLPEKHAAYSVIFGWSYPQCFIPFKHLHCMRDTGAETTWRSLPSSNCWPSVYYSWCEGWTSSKQGRREYLQIKGFNPLEHLSSFSRGQEVV